jgi:predicted metal-dependent HD superfamily phosphohydrolase
VEKVDLSQKEVVVNDLVEHALSEVERKYGKGEGDGKTPRSYHNRVHTQDVIEASQQIAQLSVEADKIKDSDIPLIKIAASFHDIEQDLGGGLNEEKSARLAEEEMRKTGLFGEEDIRKVKRMILATTVYFEGGVMKQSTTEDYLTQIITDADLSSLGKEQNVYWERAMRLLKEIKKTDTPSRDDEITFAKGQIPFLENHQFYTQEANGLFPHKQENVEFTQKHIKLLEE